MYQIKIAVCLWLDFKLLVDGAADLGDRKVFRRFPPVPTFDLHVGKINLTWLDRNGVLNKLTINEIVKKSLCLKLEK